MATFEIATEPQSGVPETEETLNQQDTEKMSSLAGQRLEPGVRREEPAAEESAVEVSGEEKRKVTRLDPKRLPVHASVVEACSRATATLDGPNLAFLGVTSSVRGEGRTSIATAMAFVQAHDYGRSTILIDADFEGPSVAGLFGLDQAPGLADVLRERIDLEDAVHDVGDGLSVLTAGKVDSPPGLAAKLAESKILQDLQTEHEVVVVDLPAIIDSRCGTVLAALFEQPLLVIRAGITPAKKVGEALEQLDREPTALLNGTRTSLPRWIRRLLE
ncbi:MAG TPA: CpsD/CapB family tyrosine-protein kinase [Candidatus Dormibacteraeota bacterium]|jgi:Mrp family chromosome partitioning ATPase|nr:CpsD/CapB family tyrosine-protein kinase [Candidatus Dormibacteraeota bacterium]